MAQQSPEGSKFDLELSPWVQWAKVVHNVYTGWLVLALSLIVTVAAYYIAKSQVEARAQEKFEFRAQEISRAIDERLQMYVLALRGGVGLFDSSELVSREEFRQYVNSLDIKARLPGIQGIGFATPVSPEEKNQHEIAIQQQGFPEYRITPEGERDFYSAIIYLEPFDWRNKRAFGYDMWSNELRREAMRRARDTGEASTSAIITLVQETDTDVQKGFLVYLPVYQKGDNKQLKGWVYAPFRTKDLMYGILGGADATASFSIYDGTEQTEQALLYRGEGFQRGVFKDEISISRVLEVEGRTWTLVHNSSISELVNASEARLPNFVLTAGIIIDLLLFYVIISMHIINRALRTHASKLHREYELNQKHLALKTQIVEEAESESNTLFELAPDALLVVSESGEIVKANNRAHQTFHVSHGTLVGRQIEELIPEESRAKHVHLRQDYQSSPVVRTMSGKTNLLGRTLSGKVFPILVNLAPIVHHGRYHIVASVLDLTAQKEIQASMAEAKEKAENANRAKSEFLANMSHEIRTPLNAVLGSAQLLNKTVLTENQKNLSKMISTSGEALLGIINDILDFSKIEAGQMELNPTAFDLQEVLYRVSIMMSVNAGEKEIELIIDVAPDVPNQLIGDPLRLQQVLINLVSNAIKFTPSGHVTLKIELVSEQGKSKTLRFLVDDSGIGINDEQQSSLFRPFSQADSSITRRFGGTGLGLIICKKIVALMEGEIKLDSVPDQGSRFYFTVTLAAAPEHKPATVQSKHVALIEENRDSAIAIENIFRRWGWRWSTFSSVAEFYTVCQNNSALTSYDFVLAGWRIKEQNNEQFNQLLRRENISERTATVIAFVSYGQFNINLNDNQMRIDSALSKPITEGILRDAFTLAEHNRSGTQPACDKHHLTSEHLQFNNMHVLLVEDNKLNQAIAQSMMEDIGLTFTIANNGLEAIDTVTKKPERFDLILMDIQMPVMDGLTASRFLRDKLQYQGPIIAMTAGVMKSERDSCLSAGMSDFVAKPIDENDLIRAIKSVLPATRSAQAKTHKIAGQLELSTDCSQIFDAVRLNNITKGKPERIRTVIAAIQNLCTSAEGDIRDAEQAYRNQKWDEAKHITHSLKGSIANYGGISISAALQTLESLFKDAASPGVDLAVEQSLQCFYDYQRCASDWIDEQEALLSTHAVGDVSHPQDKRI